MSIIEKYGEESIAKKVKYLLVKAKSDIKDTEHFHFSIGHKAYASWYYKDVGPKRLNNNEKINAEIGKWLLASIYLIEDLVSENERLTNETIKNN